MRKARQYFKIFVGSKHVMTVLAVSERAALQQGSRKWLTPVSKLRAEVV